MMTDVLTPPGALEIERHYTGEQVVYELTGGLDAAGAQALEQVCDGLVDEPRSLVLDLSRLTFIDSAGLRSILRLYGRSLKHRRELRIIPAPASVQRVFALTRAADVLPFVEVDSLVGA